MYSSIGFCADGQSNELKRLPNRRARPTDNVAAYDYYLRGRNSMRLNDVRAFKRARFLRSGAKQDPKFALAYTGVGQASLRMYGVNKDAFWTQKALAAAATSSTVR